MISVRLSSTSVAITTTFTPTASASVFQGWVDLGDMTFPLGVTLPEDQSATIPGPSIWVEIKTASGAGTLKADALKLIPVAGSTVASATLLRAQGSSSTALTGTAILIDGDAELFWGTFGGVVTALTARLSGGFLYADPAAAQTVLEMIAMSRGTISPPGPWVTSRDAQAAVDVSYHPRYLHIGDGT